MANGRELKAVDERINGRSLSWGFRDNTPVDISCIPDTPTRNPDMPVYSAEFKVKTALTYLLTCSQMKTAEKMGIDITMIRDWLNTPWWPTAVAAARECFSDRMIAGFSNIIEEAQVGLMDRMQNGEVIGEKEDEETGKRVQVRRPIKAKDLAIIASIAYDKRQISTGQPTNINKRYSSAIERADRMRGVVQRKPQPPAIEGEFTVYPNADSGT